MKSKGICYLVGAGPGDVGLVTLKAKECIEKADVLVYDALISPEFVRWTKEGCELIYVGKRADDHALTQDETNELIVQKAQEGKIVVRLKGGDPLIFGRGGEEAAKLADAGVRFEIVPGISSAIAGPAYAGIPVTHREHCSQLTIFTGHEDPTRGESRLDYEQLAKAPGTRVFLMGMRRLREICDELMKYGAAPETPIGLVRWATTGNQTSVDGTLATIADIAEEKNFKAPAVAVIGDVVKDRDKINWFEGRPLFGKKIVVTRTRSQASELSRQLEELGADVLEIPTIKIEHPDDKREFAECVGSAHTYDWLVFTSPNGVERFFEAFFSVYDDARSIGGVRIAAVGPGTAKKVNEYRLAVDLIPDKHVAEGLVEAFTEKESVENQTILWVRPQESRDTVVEGLTALGAIVDECIAYKTVPEFEDPTGAKERFEKEGADLVTFVSSSAAKHFFALSLPWPEGCKVASIGPITSATLNVIGKPADVEAEEHNIPGLVEAVVKSFSTEQG
ncbi:uroporphyrinogen-III synthase [Rubritalea squalenifaciens DSM 18772]|uniref:uroporphyrinogen-III C-methyltransferase n=2 Tax=Rubritalea TaxID=361050 RepID=A0A1M6HHJ3_9BACT|nr:uroporphyrinogen-III C-methyltransferase [Rubritalea squalenifaciens]SHJ21569.1 uroporphyrinogen-III synthase [Rubritalea squalenifaciens DSM 18772]